MVYDKDLRYHRITALLLTIANVGLAVRCFVAHAWLFALTALVWAVSSWWFRAMIRYQQHMRDSLRVAQAGLDAFREIHERGELLDG
jgi:hypothetical protein